MSDDHAPTMTRAEPMAPTDVSAPFWDGTRSGRLVLQWCTRCDAVVHYPRERCPQCLSDALEWRDASGTGTVYAVTVMNQPGNPLMESRVPYSVVLVDLDEGARMMSSVVGCDPTDVVVGQRVQVTWEPLSDGRQLPLFEPAAAP